MRTLTLELEELDREEVVSEFRPDFCKALLRKLEQLRDSNKIFIVGEQKARAVEFPIEMTQIARVVTGHLEHQLGLSLSRVRPRGIVPKEIDDLVFLAKEFLEAVSSETGE